MDPGRPFQRFGIVYVGEYGGGKIDGNQRVLMTRLDVTGMFSFPKGKQFIPERGGKNGGAAGPSARAGFHNTAGPPGFQNEVERGGGKEGLVAGEKHVILRRPGRGRRC